MSIGGKQHGDPEGPDRDDPQRLALEARLAAAAKEIDAVVAEAERLWPDKDRRWEAIILIDRDRSYLFHASIPGRTNEEL